MDTNWAAQHLETIRTLMERSALYRRALAPIATFVGIVGITAAVAGCALKIERAVPFIFYWLAIGVVAVAGTLLLVRRQATRQGESFWSPPTRRVAQAMAPPLLVGLVFSYTMVKMEMDWAGKVTTYEESLIMVVIWTLFYGLALHAAGFFAPRGIRLFGWGFLLTGMALLMGIFYVLDWPFSPNWLMGLIFGVSHLAYGIYLYFTEPQKPAA